MKKNDAQGVSARPVGRLLALPMALAMIGVVPVAQAAPVSWVVSADGNWDTATNWSSNPLLPAAADAVTINVSGLRTITFDSSVSTIASLSSAENLIVSGGALTVSGAFGNTAATTLSGGTLTLSGASNLSTLTHSGGTLDGSGVVTVAGASTWSGGSQTDAGSTSFNGPLTLSGGDGRIVSSRTVNFGGTTTWTNPSDSTGYFFTGEGATLANSGSFLDQNAFDNLMFNAYGGADSTFVNSGSYIKSGAGTTDISIGFNNSGSLDVQTGTLRLGGGGSSTGGSYTVASGATVEFSGGTHTLTDIVSGGSGTGRLLASGGTVDSSGTLVFAGTIGVSGGGLFNFNGAASAAAFEQSGGTIGGTGSLSIAGASTWSGGSQTDAGSTSFNGPLTLSGGDGRIVTSRTVNFGGTTTWTNPSDSTGYFYTGSGATLANSGSFLDQNAFDNFILNAYGGADSTFVNSGTYTKSGAGTTTIYIGFDNSGAVNVEAGVLTLSGAGNFTNYSGTTLTGGTVTVLGGASFGFTDANVVTNASTIVLDGAGSNFVDASTSGDGLANFATNAAAGRFTIRNGRDFTTAGAFTNAGTVEVGPLSTFTTSGAFTNQAAATLALSGGSFAAPTLSNAGTLSGFGSVSPLVQNSGLVRASGGTLVAQAGVNGSGNIQVDSGATLDLSSAAGASSAQRLTMDGALDLGGQNIVVSKDYSNANFGTGNSFNRRNNVSGAGQIVGQNAAQTVVGQVVGAGANTFTVDLGNVRGGTTANKSFQVQNSGTGADIRGAVQSAGAGNVTDGRLAVSTGNFGPLAVGASSGDYTISFSASSGGALVGQKAGVVSNFDNVAAQTININGFASVLAQGSATPSTDPVDLGNFRVGFTPPPLPTQNFEVSNLTSGSGAERLGIGSAGTSGNFAATNNLGANLIAPGGQQAAAVTAAVNNGVAGINNGALTIQYTTNGQLIDPSFVTQNANAQTINLQATGYNVAVGSATPDPVVLTNQRVGGMQSQVLSVANTAAAGSFTEKLNASFGSNSGHALNNGGAVSLLAAGDPGSTAMSVRLDTSVAGARSGSVTLDYQTDGTGSSGLGVASVGSQVINVSGNVYQIAQANLPADVDLGNFRLGSATSQAINITNTDLAPAGFQEGLDASVGGSSGKATASGGPISKLAQGASSNALSVGIDNATATAGANNGTVTITLASNGSGTSGLATMTLSDATINVSGTGYNAAVGNATPTPVVLANQRVGGMQSQALTVANTAAAGAFTEKLNASFGSNSGHALNNGGAVSLLAAGDPGSTAMTARVDTSAAGARSGSVTLNYQTDGSDTSGLAAASAGSQVINVSGNVYQLASGQINSLPLNFGTVQVGQSVSQILSISNTASGAAGFVEDLNAAFGASSGTGSSLISGSGSISGLIAGATNASGMTVSVDTSAAATVNGAIAVNFTSAGAVSGVDNGLGTLALGSVDYGVQGLIQANVINTASPLINNSPIDLGKVRIGATSPTALVSVSNQATTAPQAALNATISGNGPIDAGGSFNLLNPGGTNNTDLQVGMNTASAGAINGTATIAFVSDASNVGGCAPNCQLNLPSQDVSVSGAVYRLANPLLNTSEVSLAARVGDAAPSATISVTNSSPDIYTEGLKVSTGSAPAGFTNSGSIGNLAAGGTDASSLKLTLDTATAGTFSGSQTLAFKSTGAGTTDAVPDIDVGNGTVTVGGKVYTPAVATLNTASNVNFGIVHVGDSVSQAISVSNTAPVSALNDVLRGEFSSASAPFSGGGTLGAGLDAGATDSSSLSVGMNTAAAGNYSGSATFVMSSHDADLVDLALPDLSVSLSGTVNNYAKSIFTFGMGDGSFKADGNSFVLDFGTQLLGSGALKTTLYASNGANGLADLLDGDFNFLDGIDFAEDGFDPFIGLGAGELTGPLLLTFNTGKVGSYVDTILLSGFGHNASGYRDRVADVMLTVRGSVIQDGGTVPEPGTLWLATLALLAMGRRAIRRAAASEG